MHRLLLLVLLLTACAGPAPATNVAALAAPDIPYDAAGTAPTTHGLTHAPATIDKAGSMTFKVDAAAAPGRTLTYQWFASKGTITPNGASATWKPVKADGSVDAGLATIAVTVGDGGGSTTPTALVSIAADGSVTTPGTGPTASAAPD